jgi:fatty acid omega-hydroxylase
MTPETAEATKSGEANMTPEAAWAKAMSYEHRPNPYPFFDQLRKTPVAHVGNGLYVVTGYRELMTLAHDPRISSDTRRMKARAATKAGSEADPSLAAYGEHGNMIMADPPEHDRMRRQSMRHFGPPHTPDLIPKMETDIKRLFNQLLDKARGKTRIDVVDDYAYPVPVAVISRIMGVPLEDESKLHPWLHDFMAGLMDMGPDAATPEGKARFEKGKAGMAKTVEYFTDLTKGYLKTPADTMLSKMVNEEGPDGKMSPREVVTNATLLFIAGHDSTVNTISHCVLTVLRNPGTFELLRRRPEVLPSAVEEVLRLQSAVQFFPSRSATDDIEIAGTVIPKGSQVHLVYGAANRDPKKFPDPNKFDPERRGNEHFGWGSGVHTCFGGPLARLEVNFALETFINRVENPRLVEDPPEYRRSNVFRGPLHLFIDCDRIKD